MSTPLRAVQPPESDGVGLLGSPDIAYSDGSEGRLLEILGSARDLGSMSDELEASAETWAERYHLTKSRANVVRALDLSADATVLEVGAGCGAITRYLGETCRIVDAIEPIASRADAAALRTRDLDGVSVFRGVVEDVPVEPAYDIVFVIGVLEYVANGRSDLGEYAEFLSALRSLLLPGGRIVCAIENQLGVKYLCGAPEDHSNRVFDGIEDYPLDGPARTFSRKTLARVFGLAGMDVDFLHAFPDYKLSRLVFADSLVEDPTTRDLAWRIPAMPSPDWQGSRPRHASERHLWRTLVESGLGREFSNSFVVVSRGDETGPGFWPEDRHATFFTTERRAEFATRTDVDVDTSASGRSTLFHRRIMGSPSVDVQVDDVHLHVADSVLIEGQDLIDLLAGDDDAGLESAVKNWVDFALSEQGDDPWVEIDLVPHNIVVDGNGEWHAIDQEWRLGSSPADFLVMRGVFWLGVRLARVTPPARWPDDWLTLDLVIMLGGFAGLDSKGLWLDAFMDEEAVVQTTVHHARRDDPGFADAVSETRAGLAKTLARPLSLEPLGTREHEFRRAFESDLVAHREHLAATREHLAEVEALAHVRGTELREIQTMLDNSRGWRFVNRIDRVRKALLRSAGGTDPA